MTPQELRKISKVEFHRHLDGSVRTDTIRELAKLNNIQIDEIKRITHPMKSLNAVLDMFWTQQKVMCNYESIKRVAFENVEDAFRDGVKLIELRYAPSFIAKNKNLGNDEIIEGVIDGITQGMVKYPIQVGLIHIAARGLSLEHNKNALEDTFKYMKTSHKNADRIVGFDMADSENNYDKEGFKNLLFSAKEAGLQITVHSGEDTTAEDVRYSIEVLQAKRIGHGIQSINDESVLELIKEKDIHLEVCPTSNYLTHSVKSLEDHPLRKLYDKGISLSLNSDDPNIMNIDLVDEYQVAQDIFKFTGEEFQKLNQNALKYSFLPKELIAEIKL